MYFLPALAVLFIALKLTGVIAWSWWLVLLPSLIAPLFFLIGMIGGLTYIIAQVYKVDK